MACAPRAGLDLPQKLLLWEADGLVRVAYNDPAYLVRRHTITGCEEIVATIAENLRAISTLVAGRQDAPETLTSPTTEELRLLFEGDQADRQFETPPTPEEWAAITKRDNTRRNRVLDLVKSDALVSGKDFYHAAMVLQHGPGSEDILVAHILSTAAAYLGDARGKWLSAAALDRYLHRTKAAQRIGTQYVRANNADPWSQGAYDDWLPDSIRTIFGVEGRAQQQERVRGMNRHAP